MSELTLCELKGCQILVQYNGEPYAWACGEVVYWALLGKEYLIVNSPRLEEFLRDEITIGQFFQDARFHLIEGTITKLIWQEPECYTVDALDYKYCRSEFVDISIEHGGVIPVGNLNNLLALKPKDELPCFDVKLFTD